MTRPILWALGTLGAAALSATVTGGRLADRFATRPPGPAEQGPTAPAAGPILTVTSDLAGHYVLHPSLDGRRLRMLVDTGASLVTLSYEDARLAGIAVETGGFTRRLATANGQVEAAPIRIREMRVGEITVRDVEAVVLPPGRLGTSLLGMSFLRRLRAFEIAAGRLTLKG